MQLQKRYLEQARELHRNFPAADAHLDLAGELLLRLKNGEENALEACYMKNLREAGMNLVVSSVYLDQETLPEQGLRNALDQIGALLQALEGSRDFFLVKSRKDLEEAVLGERIGVMLFLEGMDFLGTDLLLLPVLWELGVRGASLTWSRRNALADGCCKASENTDVRGGLSSAGKEAVRRMEELGMILDISHLNDDGIQDVLELAKGPVIATHSNSRAVCPHYRNLKDEQLLELGRRGGMVGLNGCDLLVGCRPGEEALELMCRHLEHEAELMGTGCLGFGFDFCDSYDRAVPKAMGRKPSSQHDCLGNHSRVPELTAALLQRGMEEEAVKKVIGGNLVEFFRRTLP